MEGIQSPFVYFGAIFTSFAWHKEDCDTSSINYLHRGKSKHWYGIPASEVPKFEQLLKTITDGLDANCESYFRHKTILISPQTLQKHGISFTRVSCRFFPFFQKFIRIHPIFPFFSIHSLDHSKRRRICHLIFRWIP